MSWWDTSNFTSLASQAVKNVQKKIDKVLDIQEEEGAKRTSVAAPKHTGASGQSRSTTSGKGLEFGKTWSSGGDEVSEESKEKSPNTPSSWSFPWGAAADDSSGESKKTQSAFSWSFSMPTKEEVLAARADKEVASTGSGQIGIEEETRGKSFVKEMATDKKGDNSENKADTAVIPVQHSEESAFKKYLNTKDIMEKTKSVSGKSTEEKVGFVKDSGSGELDKKVTLSDSKDSGETDKGADAGQSVQWLSDSESVLQSLGIAESAMDDEVSGFKQDDVLSQDSSVILVCDESKEGEKFSRDQSAMEKTTEAAVVQDVEGNVQEGTGELSVQQVAVIEPDSGPEPSSDLQTKSTVDENEVPIESEPVVSVDDSEGSGSRTDSPADSCGEGNFLGVSRGSASDISSSVEIVQKEDIPDGEEFGHSDTENQSVVSVQQEESIQPEEAGTVCVEKVESESDIKDGSKPISAGEVVCDTQESKTEVDEDVKDFSASQSTETTESLLVQDVKKQVEEMCMDSENVSVGQAPGCEQGAEVDEELLHLKQELEDSDREAEKSPLSRTDSEGSKLDISMDTATSEDTVIEQESGSERDIVSSREEGATWEQGEVTSEGQTQAVEEDNSASLLHVDTDLGEEDEKSGDGESKKEEISPSNSFVKCMIEDAMDDNSKQEDNGSDTHSIRSRSIHSGHTSSDEIDTTTSTTSSDIEIISLPTPNGENRQVSPIDPIPLKIALQKTSWRGSPTHAHRRTDSQSSSSTNSKEGTSEQQLSPGRDCDMDDGRDYYERRLSQEHAEENRQRMSELPALDEEDDNPYHPHRLIKDGACGVELCSGPTNTDQVNLEQKMAEMAEVIEARETKLIQLSKDNNDLMETNSILRSQLQQLEEVRETEQADLQEITTELTQRLTEAEKRYQAVIKEKEACKRQLHEAQAELCKRDQDTSHLRLLEEKDQQIAELLQEGEKLSKQQLQNSNIIKKLRVKEKESDTLIANQKKKLESQTTELDHLHKVLDSKEKMEKKQTEAINQLNTAVQRQEAEFSKVKSELDDSQEKVRSLQVALDNSYKEIAELHKSNAVQDSKAQEAALSAEMQVREELKLTIEKQQYQFKREKEALIMQIEDLRLSMTRMEKEHSRREDMLRQEISDLQQQLQEDEARNQELTQGVSSATRPLLRQIENLQSNYKAQSSAWEKAEKNITDRLVDTQDQLAMAMEKERNASEQVIELGGRVKTLETQNTRLKQEKSQLNAQLEMARAKVEVLEDAKHNEMAQLELVKQQMSQEMTELKKEKVFLETQVDVEKNKVEQEKKKMLLAQEQIRELERELQRPRSRGTPSPVSISRQESTSSFISEPSQFNAITQEELDRSFILSPNGNKQSLYEALRQSGAVNLLENLQSQLKLREGEIQQLQSEIRQLERTRESMARELVNLSNQNDELQEQVKELPELKLKLADTDQRYNAMLQMYGEKVEETEELRLDLQDIKEMYKAQIDHLLAK